jgi:hypothetical protein
MFHSRRREQNTVREKASFALIEDNRYIYILEHGKGKGKGKGKR